MSEKTPDFTPEENEIIDALGSRFSIQELTNAQVILQQLNKNHLSTEVSQIIEAIKRKTESIFYAFSGIDEYAEHENTGALSEGIWLHQRFGNTLKSFGMNLKDIKDVIKILKEKNICTIYTGNIDDNGFLGLDGSCIIDECLVSRYEMENDEIQIFEEAGIKVIKLLELK